MRSPITGSDNVSLIQSFDPYEIASRWRSNLLIDLGSQFVKIHSIELWRCNDTNLYWFTPEYAAANEELYAQLAKFDWYYMNNKWEFDIALNYLKPGEQVLEVGVGHGDFLTILRSKGILASGVELNSSAAECARQMDFEVFECSLNDLAINNKQHKFDAVCSFQVLEHVPNPKDFIDGMLLNLRVGGKLILSTPNAAVMRRIDPNNEDILNIPPHHLTQWDQTTFEALQKIFPLRLCAVHCEPMAEYHINWMTIGYLRSRYKFIGRFLARALFNKYTVLPLSFLLKLGLRKRFPGHTIIAVFEKVS